MENQEIDTSIHKDTRGQNDVLQIDRREEIGEDAGQVIIKELSTISEMFIEDDNNLSTQFGNSIGNMIKNCQWILNTRKQWLDSNNKKTQAFKRNPDGEFKDIDILSMREKQIDNVSAIKFYMQYKSALEKAYYNHTGSHYKETTNQNGPVRIIRSQKSDDMCDAIIDISKGVGL